MKKVLLVLALVILLIAVITGSVDAATNKHGQYATNTDACAGCHRTHSAQYINLININAGTGKNDTYELCTYCHSATGESKYDVVDGRIQTGTNYWAAPGGGFTNALIVEGSVTGTNYEVKPITSKHNVDSLNGATNYLAPGGHATAQFDLTCANCHDPHGTGSYRTLKTTIATFDVNGAVLSDPVGTISATATADANGKETVTYNDTKFNDFCGSCHRDYENTTVNGDTNFGYYNTGLKRHKVGMTPSTNNAGYDNAKLILPLGNGSVTCLTCHFAHGSTTSSTYSGGSTLLRMDERGVCQNCHNKNPRTTAPTFIDRDTVAAGTNATSLNPNNVVVTFDSYMDKTSVQTVSNWSITGPITVTINSVTLQPDGKSVLINTATNLATAGTYTVTVTTNLVKDINGTATVANGPTAAFIK